jgi:diguanylate cyclase (GGDEF)-like protein
MRILLVEDDEQTAVPIANHLIAQHYLVDRAPDGQAGWELAETLTYDLILLDIMLPELDGISLLKKLRSQGHKVPVLLLTARGVESDKVMGLDAGADDYVVKPVKLPELAARIRALLRRGGTVAAPILQWGNLCLNPSSCEVTYSDRPLNLTPKEYAILELLLRHSHRVYSRSAILDRLWSFDEVPGEETVTSHIKGLRQKLKALGATDLIETVYGLGYRLNRAELKPPTPTSPPSADSQKQEEMRAFIARVWDKAKPNLLQQVAVVVEAAEVLLSGELPEEMQQQAKQQAHKLAGSLGTYGLAAGSELAKQIETILESERSSVNAQKHRLYSLTSSLQQLVEATDSQSLQQKTVAPLEAIKISAKDKSPSLPLLLVVDSDRSWAEQLVIEAKIWGWQSAIAADPQAARTAMQQQRPDAVLLELYFDGSNAAGLQLLAELSALTPPIPILVLTSSDRFTDRVAVARRRAQIFFQKIATPTQVLETLTQVCQQTKTTPVQILAVDDDRLILDSLCALLEPWGLAVNTLDRPQQFWDCLETINPELVILDVEMPAVTGIELCQTIRDDPRWGWLPVLFLTSKNDAETIQQVFIAGADDYVSKPIVAPELLTRILNRLERSRMLRSQAEIDLLTGTANCQKSVRELNKYLLLAKRSQQPMCLVVLELDNLKQLNHQYGYEAGDRVLRQCGQLLLAKLRREDIVSRWGGAEFVLGLYGMTKADALEWMAEILAAARSQVKSQKSKVKSQKPALPPINFSVGAAQYPDDGTDLQTLYRTAQSVLFSAPTTKTAIGKSR